MANLGIGTSKLKPKVADIDPMINIKLLSENSFYTRFNFEFATENLNSLGESISIDFQGRDLTDFIQFKTNLVLPIDDISGSFSGISTLSSGDSVIGLTTFSLYYNSNSFLKKTVSNSNIGSNSSSQITINLTNHDFSTGELIAYEYDTTPIEILPTSFPGIGVTSYLPSKVYAIKNSINFFSVAASESDAYSGIGVTFVSVAPGTNHIFYPTNTNTRSLISIDNIIQSPLYRRGISVGLGTTSIGISTTTIPLSGVTSVRYLDFLYIDDEVMKVKAISTGSTSVTVERGTMGTVAAAHTNGSTVYLYSGEYNIVKDKIYFVSPPNQSSTFTGRIFYKNNYNKNVIFDDLSSEFVGTGKTFTLKYNGSNYGLSTSIVTGESYGILSLNGLFQNPVEDYVLQSTTGISTITFVGNNEFELPNAGKILSFDYTGGSKYQTQVAAAATVTVSSGGTITSVTLTGNGGGYQETPTVSIASTVGTGATIIALVGTGASVGLITGFSITNAGTGYTTSSVPLVVVEPPYGYSNLPLNYVSGSNNGQGAKVSLVVGSGGSITSVDIDDIGIGYESGDVLTVSGIGTLSGHTPFTLTVKDTYTDSFAFWSFGQLKRTSITPVPDGNTKIFVVNDIDTGTPINFERNNIDPRFDITNNLIVTVNGVLQKPVIDYTILNSFITFSEVIPLGQDIRVYIYTASNEDSILRDILPTIKSGDILKLKGKGGNEVDQEPRSVYRIENKNRVKTSTYNGLGIDSDKSNFKKLDWTKQTRDSIVSNKKTYKVREIYDPLIKPKSSLIVGIGTTSSSIYVENIDLFNSDGIPEKELQVEIVKDIPLTTSTVSSSVSAAGTVSSISILDGGSGYSQLNPPVVSISKTEITRYVELESFSGFNNPTNIKYFDSQSSDSTIVSVGSSLSYRYSTSLAAYSTASIASSTTDLKSISYGNSIWIVAGTDGYISTSKNLSSWGTVGISSVDTSSFPETLIPYTFTGSINSISYDTGVFVGVGSSGNVFSYDVLDASRISRFGNNFISRTLRDENLNTIQISEKLNKVITGSIYNLSGSPSGTQFVAVGDNGTILLSPSVSEGQRLGTKSVSWMVKTLSTLSGKNLNSIANTGISTIPYIVVGDDGLILTFPNDLMNDGSYYNVTGITTQHLKSVVYDSSRELAIIVGTAGSMFVSEKSSSFKTWKSVSSGTTSILNDIENFIPLDRYLIVGDSKSITSQTEKIGAAATAVVSAAGTISSIVITNGGRYYGSAPAVVIEAPDLTRERFKSCKIIGDYGGIVGVSTTTGISTTSPALKFHLLVDSELSKVTSGISTGDYFATYNTNIGSGVTSILSNGSVVGIGTSFIDCVFRADSVIPNSGVVIGITTVISNVKSLNGLTSIATTYYSYGNYSWGKIYDFDTRVNPIIIDANNLNGSAGLSTSPKVTRVTSIGVTVVPLEA